ncbi:MAG: methyl-accepting chemotaxis protein, partial [Deltaproteobacteria bacterium]|nr:methyl-accepting chemotaxis protein [Deltaproteobacteria bacterium]
MSNLPATFLKISPHLVKIFTVVAVVTIGLFGSLVWHTWDTFRYLETTQKNYFRLAELSGSIAYLDEVLTMSSRMAAATGEQKWEAR